MKKSLKDNSTFQTLLNGDVRRVKNTLFFSGLAALLLVLYGFCYVTESRYLSDPGLFSFWTQAERSVSFKAGEWGILPGVFYTVSAPGLRPETVEATAFFYYTILALAAIGFFNGLITLIARSAAKGQIQRQLEPLYKMTEAAKRLSDEGGARAAYQKDKARLHDLESAIDSIGPDKPNAKLHTGYADLQSLEEAINGLMNRTRESYSQQIRFVSDASHELRTPIAVIKGYTDMLDRWGKSDEKILDESISAIKTETERMNTLVEQLLFLARGDSGRTRLNMEEFSLSDIMREVYGESVMIDDGHKWELIAEEEVSAYGDPALLKQAARILVDNAAKYTPAGETISLKARYDGDGAPVIEVQDNGSGIPGEDLSHIFDRFFRADASRSGKQSGTGLGLSIAKWIVDSHGGYFNVVSREGLGTRVSIHLPKDGEKEG